MIWDGYPGVAEDERESAWHDPEEEEAEAWKGERPPSWRDEGEEWKTYDWRNDPTISPQGRMYREMLESEDDEEGV